MELRTNETVWRRVFDPDNIGNYEELYHMIEFVGVGPAGEKNWMTIPETGFLIAQRWGVIFHTFNIRGCDTIFPLLARPGRC